jgi:hypothetical protein
MAGGGDVLGRRALNRATLARQLLLGRRDLPVVEPTLLIDGQVVAIWKLVHAPDRATTLEIQPLEGVPATDLTAATREGELLLTFAAAEAPDHDIRVLGPER